MQGITRSQIIPAVSSKQAFAEIDARNAAKAAQHELVLSPAELLHDHDPARYPAPPERKVRIVTETDGTGAEIHVEVFPDGRITLWSSDNVLWFTPSDTVELIAALCDAHVESSGIVKS
jgi:hypothetical protein